jgi:hypothetical protein
VPGPADPDLAPPGTRRGSNIAEDVIFIVEARDVRHGTGLSVDMARQADGRTGVDRRRTSGTMPV